MRQSNYAEMLGLIIFGFCLYDSIYAPISNQQWMWLDQRRGSVAMLVAGGMLVFLQTLAHLLDRNPGQVSKKQVILLLISACLGCLFSLLIFAILFDVKQVQLFVVGFTFIFVGFFVETREAAKARSRTPL